MKVALARLKIAMSARLRGHLRLPHRRLQGATLYETKDRALRRGRQVHASARPGCQRRQLAPGTPHLDAVGLCQPLPTDDVVHLSHVDGTEC
jgi:hypothetical protein